MEAPANTVQPRRTIASLGEALSELMGLTDQAQDVADHEAAPPCCPHCGSCRTRLLGECPGFGIP
jgi:hypothetical protein